MLNQNQVLELDIELEHEEQRLIKRMNFKIFRPSRIVVLNIGPRLKEIVAAQEAAELTVSAQATPTKRSQNRQKKSSLIKETPTRSSTSASANTSTRTT